jgi:uncharacterized protein YbjT (DUF2867 family)
MTITVTGSTGTIGTELVRLLSEAVKEILGHAPRTIHYFARDFEWHFSQAQG